MSSLRRYCISIVVLIAVVITVSFCMGWPLGFVALAAFVGWPLIGTLITIDDDFPGGWSNPIGNTVPEWQTLNWYLDILMCRGAIVLLAFAFQFRTDQNLSFLLLAVAVLIGLFGFRRIFKIFHRPDIN